MRECKGDVIPIEIIMKKILFVITQSGVGGAQRYVFEAATSLQLEGYQVLVAAGEGDGELFKKISIFNSQFSKLNPVKTFSLKHLKRVPSPWRLILAIFEISNLLKKEGPEVLFLCSTTAGILGALAGFLFKLTTKKW